MYLSRPPISPNTTKQLATKPTVKLHRGKGNATTVMVLDADEVRHPTTQQWQKRYQNQQSTATAVPIKKTTSEG
jgi:hypothetical protein